LDNTKNDISFRDINYFILTHFVPDVISNRLVSLLGYPEAQQFTVDNVKLINDSLTVYTIYFKSFFLLGWLGPLLVFNFLIIYIQVVVRLLKHSNPFFVTGICFLNTTIGLCFFTNMLSQTSALAPIVYSIVFGIYIKKKSTHLSLQQI
jgi:hypothetical protein